MTKKRSVWISKRKKLAIRVELEAALEAAGYLSLQQANKILKKHGVKSKSMSLHLFGRMSNAVYIRIWNPGTISFFDKLNIGPPNRNILVAKYVGHKGCKKQPGKWINIAFCTYIATEDLDYKEMLSILNRKGYVNCKSFPPLLHEYCIVRDDTERFIFWAEENDHNPEEDPQGPMPEWLDVPGS